MGPVKLFTQHDTPPPILFMQGSCIMEVGFIETGAQANISLNSVFEQVSDKQFQLLHEELFLAHVKVVDGSGEMLFKFDNNGQEPIVVILKLSRKGEYVGELSLALIDGRFILNLPSGSKLDLKPEDQPMNPQRIKLRCLDAASDGNHDIEAVEIEKTVRSGSIPIYRCTFADLKSEGVELKVMAWFEAGHH